MTLLSRLSDLVVGIGGDVKTIQSKPSRDIKASAGNTQLCVPGVKVATQSTVALSANRDYMMPWFVDTVITFDQLSTCVTSAGTAGGVGRAALCSATSDLQPIGNIIEDFGTVAVDSLGVKTWTPAGGSRTLQPGRYMMLYNTSVSSSTLRTITATTALDSALGAASLVNSMYKTRPYAVFPTAAPLWDVAGLSTAGHLYWVFARLTAVA